MTHRKKLIEVALPLEAINKASAREKSIRHGHPSTLHLWWARRPLAAARAVIFTSLVDDPDDPEAPPAFVAACKALPKVKNALENDTPRMRLFDFIELLVQWESTTNEQVLETARELIRLCTDGNPPPLLDPFAGGGSIPLEAQRLGLEAHASDLNPVAVMINKAMIEIPPRFANQPPVNPDEQQKIGSGSGWKGAAGLAADVRYYGQWMRKRAWEKICHLYPTHNGETVIAWLWARTVKSPNPAVDVHVPLVRSFELSKKKGKWAWINPQIDPATNEISFEVKTGEGRAPAGTVVRQGGRCLATGTPIPFTYIREEGKAGRIGSQLMAIVTEGQKGRHYYTPSEEHSVIAKKANGGYCPDGEISHWPGRTNVVEYGMTTFGSLFTPRQLVALTTFSDLVAEARKQAHQDAIAAGLPDDDVPLRDGGQGARAYGEAVSVYLAMGVNRLADRQSTICSWDNGYTKIRNTFARQAIPMTWDFAEGNPFSSSTGNFIDLLEWVCKSLETNPPVIEGVATQTDATQVTSEAPLLISTDPPYYDNIGYADLSDFFYVWMRRNLRNVYPKIFDTMLVPKEPELVATPYRFDGNKAAANKHFEVGLESAFAAIRRFISLNTPLTVYYAFKQSENLNESLNGNASLASTGWETMLSGLVDSGFLINGTWPMRTEMSNRTVASGTNALASSIVLVCRPRPDDAPVISRREFVNLLRRELPAALQEMQSGNIAPVDLAQAAIGPGMAVYSRYKQVLEANGEALTVRAALQLINQELDSYLSEQEGDVDGDTRFAIAWFDQNGFGEAEFGLADVLARAKNTSVDGIVQSGIAASGRGKVRLRHWQDADWLQGWDPTKDERIPIWEATHHLIWHLENRGESGTARLLLQLPGEVAAEARQLAYRLYSICERKGWADHARAYNGLVISWPAIQEEVNRLRQEKLDGEPTEQARLFDV